MSNLKWIWNCNECCVTSFEFLLIDIASHYFTYHFLHAQSKKMCIKTLFQIYVITVINQNRITVFLYFLHSRFTLNFTFHPILNILPCDDCVCTFSFRELYIFKCYLCINHVSSGRSQQGLQKLNGLKIDANLQHVSIIWFSDTFWFIEGF